MHQQCRRTSYSGYHGHQSNAISMYYIITMYTSPGIKLYQKYWWKGKKHKESSDKVWDNQELQSYFKESEEECYAIVARNNLLRLLFLLCIAYVPFTFKRWQRKFCLKTWLMAFPVCNCFLVTKPCPISVQSTFI